LAKFHLPKSRKHIQTFFYQDKKLIISAEENQNSLIAIYTIEDKSFKPLKYYKISGPFKQAQLVGDRFYLITQKQTTKDSLEALLKANGEDNNFFPKLEQAIKYGLKTSIISEATCQKIAHNITDGELPTLTSLAIFNLNSLDTQPEIKFLLGQLDHIAIGPEYLYFLKPHNNTGIACKNCSQKAEGSGEKTLIQGFSLDPKLYQSNNAILSGTLLSSKNYLTEDFKLEIPLYQTSGKMKQYRILQADNKLSTFTTTILAETGSNYQNIIKESGSYQLSNNETTLIITQNNNQYLLPTSERRKNQLFTLGNNLIKIQNTNNAITIKSTEIGQSKGGTLLSLNNAELLDNMYWNSEQKILSLITRENGKTTLRGYDLGDPKEAKLLFKRTYPVISTLKHLDLYINMEKYTVLIAQGIADFFVTRNHQLTKTIKIK
ncbi:MAG: beta-propeller domain-containing protein, partial [candidate division SR1 bacterium]|nr:beta-propeller domain-containing protein [candidate division SR1 bacterium]